MGTTGEYEGQWKHVLGGRATLSNTATTSRHLSYPSSHRLPTGSRKEQGPGDRHTDLTLRFDFEICLVIAEALEQHHPMVALCRAKVQSPDE